MNKIKMFAFASALTLITVGVFAGKAKFAAPSGAIYASADGTKAGGAEISASLIATDLSSTGSIQAAIEDQSANTYGLYYDAGTTSLYPLYFTK